MAAASGCLVLSFIYLLCDFNPLSTGGYPDIEFAAFPGKVRSRTLFYSYEAWANLKTVTISGHNYNCNIGQCILISVEPGRGITPTVSSSPNLKTGNGQKSAQFISSINQPDNFSAAITINPLPAVQMGMKEQNSNVNQPGDFPTLVTVNPSPAARIGIREPHADMPSTLKPSSGSKIGIRQLILATNQPKDVHTATTDKSSSGLGSGPGELKIGQIMSTFKDVKKQIQNLYVHIKDLIIGFSSGVISIPILGGSIYIGVKIYRKKQHGTTIPEHLYTPLHNSSTITYECDVTDAEDIDVFDIRNLPPCQTQNLTPSAPEKTETSPKRIISPKKCQPTLMSCEVEVHHPPRHNRVGNECQTLVKKPIKSRHRRSRSEERATGSNLALYNFRPRDETSGKTVKKKNETISTEL